jgi:uncharacterized integral membrane protein
MTFINHQPTTYDGQFGPYTITHRDRRGVVLYRSGLLVAALTFAVGTGLGLLWPDRPLAVQAISGVYTVFWLALGLSLATIHIYLVPLHRLLQGFWLIGGVASLGIAHAIDGPFAATVATHPETIWGIGFLFAALTGIFFKEAFCFNRFETKLLTPLVPLVLLGHLFDFLPATGKSTLLVLWACLFLVFAGRKLYQPIDPDIGDKSVFEYLKRQKETASAT